MAILRNIDIAKKYKVSPATVQNWINYTLEKKLDLELSKINGRTFIDDTNSNNEKILKIKSQGVKFRSKNTVVRVTPDPRIYDIFTEEQLINLFVNITDYNNIPVKFSYTDIGAKYYYEAFQEELNVEGSGVSSERAIINKHLKDIIQHFTDEGKKINLIEMGWGYSTDLIRDAIDYLIRNGSLNNYVSIGNSQEMYDIRSRSVQEWFGIQAKKYIIDMEDHTIQPILFLERNNDPNIVNICLVLNSGIGNIINPNVFLGGLSLEFTKNDYLVISTRLTNKQGENKINRKIWTLNKPKIMRYLWLLDLLNINNYVSVSEPVYDSEKRESSRNIIVNKDLEIVLIINKQPLTIRISRDAKISLFASKSFQLEELIDIFNWSQLSLEQYNFLKDGYTGMFFLSKNGV